MSFFTFENVRSKCTCCLAGTSGEDKILIRSTLQLAVHRNEYLHADETRRWGLEFGDANHSASVFQVDW